MSDGVRRLTLVDLYRMFCLSCLTEMIIISDLCQWDDKELLWTTNMEGAGRPSRGATGKGTLEAGECAVSTLDMACGRSSGNK